MVLLQRRGQGHQRTIHHDHSLACWRSDSPKIELRRVRCCLSENAAYFIATIPPPSLIVVDSWCEKPDAGAQFLQGMHQLWMLALIPILACSAVIFLLDDHRGYRQAPYIGADEARASLSPMAYSSQAELSTLMTRRKV